MYSSEHLELISRLSGNDALNLLEIINMSLSCREEEDFKSLFPKIQGLFPFDFAGAISGYCENGDGLVIVHGVNVSFPENWLREYLSKDYFHLDWGIKNVFRTCELLHWSLLTKIQDIECHGVPKEIIDLNMDFGVKEGYTHGSRASAPGQNGSVFCFSGSSMKYDPRTAAILGYLVPHLHLALSNIAGKKLPDKGKINLSGREKEVLQWLKEGKSSWEISVILGISESTVNFHVYNVMGKLGAANRPQAVAIATHLGLADIG